MSTNNGYAEYRKRMTEDKKSCTGKLCPISPNIPTRMTRDGFIRACKRIRAGAKGPLEVNHWRCPDCVFGRLVDKGSFFHPPGNITFVTLAEFQEPMLEVYVKQIKLRREAGIHPILTSEIVAFLRAWHKSSPDITITKKAEILGISRRQVGRIIAGQRWKI